MTSPEDTTESCSGSLPLPLFLSSSFFHFILRFWNHIFMCLSVRFSMTANSTLLGLEIYLLKRNSFSSSRSWALVYAVLVLLFSSWSIIYEPPAHCPFHVWDLVDFIHGKGKRVRLRSSKSPASGSSGNGIVCCWE